MYWLLLSSFFFTTILHALSTPVEDAALREVARLEYAAEPLGGLVPYRVGQLMAYADTSGKLVIAPFGRWPGISNTHFFRGGFVVIHPLLKRVIPLRENSARSQEPVRLAILNARGEVLLVRRSEAAVLQHDGSILCMPHWQAYNRFELSELSSEYLGRSTYFDNWVMTPTLPYFDRSPAKATGAQLPDTLTWDTTLPYVEWLGIGRVARRYEGEAKQVGTTKCLALGDWQGKLLTKFDFADIQRFHEGVAVVETSTSKPQRKAHSWPNNKNSSKPQFTYLDTVGRRIISRLFDYAGPFSYGRAVVGIGDRMGVIDLKGHFLIPLGKQWISGPDSRGYLRLVKDSTIKGAGNVQMLAPAGMPTIAQVFIDAQGFRQGYAEVRTKEQAGLIDKAGNWITHSPYDVLRTPGKLRSGSKDSDEYAPYKGEPEPPYLSTIHSTFIPDSTLLVGEREGKIGLIRRATGQEVVPLRYDDIILNPCHGMACLRRAGADYLVSSFNGREIAATYQGYEFLTPEGRRLVVTRRSPASWALADTLAQLHTPWIPGTGYPTPYGHLLSFEKNSFTLYSHEGKALLTAEGITQPPWGNIWAEIKGNAWYRNHLNDEFTNGHYQLPLIKYFAFARGVYFVKKTATQKLNIYDAQLHQVGELPLLSSNGKEELVVLESGWSTLVEYVGKGRELETVVKKIFTDEGQLLPISPSNTKWALDLWGDYPKLWRKFGLLPTTAGFVTRGKRQLWQK